MPTCYIHVLYGDKNQSWYEWYDTCSNGGTSWQHIREAHLYISIYGNYWETDNPQTSQNTTIQLYPLCMPCMFSSKKPSAHCKELTKETHEIPRIQRTSPSNRQEHWISSAQSFGEPGCHEDTSGWRCCMGNSYPLLCAEGLTTALVNSLILPLALQLLFTYHQSYTWYLLYKQVGDLFEYSDGGFIKAACLWQGNSCGFGSLHHQPCTHAGTTYVLDSLPCAQDVAETLVPLSPSNMIQSDIAQKTLQELDEHEKARPWVIGIYRGTCLWSLWQYFVTSHAYINITVYILLSIYVKCTLSKHAGINWIYVFKAR